MDNVIISILLVVVGLLVGAFIMIIVNKLKVSAAQKEADKLIQDAKKEAEKAKRDGILELKEESYKLKNQTDAEIKEKKKELNELNQRIDNREKSLDKRDELLTEREKISSTIQEIIDKATDDWGVSVSNVELKDIALPEEMKRVIAKAAEAEREKTAVITKSTGEVEAAKNLAEAATIMASTPGALHLRTLSTLNDVSSDQSNTIIFAIPLEVLRAFEGSEGKSNIVDNIKKIAKK